MTGFRRFIMAAVLMLPGLTCASIIYPALDIQDTAGDAGATITGTTFDIDSSVVAIITGTNPTTSINLIPDEIFTLTSTGSYDGTTGLFSGSFTVGSGLLSGTFVDLAVVNLGTSLSYQGDLIYTGGSLAGGLAGGRIEGGIIGGGNVAKLGAVVPVPAAVWLFGSGLLGLFGVAKRKKP